MTACETTGGALLMDCLIALGGKRGFGVPGESYLAVLDAMYDRKDEFSFMLCRHEGGAAYMAEAWGKLTGEPGLCFVTRGPGATNASIGIHTAMQNSTPMIVFVGQVGITMKGREAFQEIDYVHYFGKVAKWVVEIDDVERIPEIMSRAWTTALANNIDVQTNFESWSSAVSKVTENGITVDCGGMDIRLHIERLPGVLDVHSVSGEQLFDLEHDSEKRLYVRVTQEDGHQAWSSPIYVQRSKA